MKMDTFTFWVFFGFWPVWFVVEMVLLIMRARGMSVDLISMEARERAYQMNVIPLVWGGLGAHFWFNWARPYSVPYPAIVFWLVVAATLFLDYHFWQTPYSTLTGWLRVARWPGTQLLLGLILGVTLFPQSDVFKH